MNRYLLDTDIALYAIRRNPDVRGRLDAHSGAVAISALAHGQLLQGLGRHPETRDDVERFVAFVPVIAYDIAASLAYGRVVAALGFSRPLMVDRMIAAHAISVGAVLVTNNVRDFADIPGLVVENWAEPNS